MSKRPFLGWFASPSILIAFGIAASFLAIVQYSLRAHVPGSLDPGGFTLDNFTTLWKAVYGQAFLNTVLLCFWTALFTLLVALTPQVLPCACKTGRAGSVTTTKKSSYQNIVLYFFFFLN